MSDRRELSFPAVGPDASEAAMAARVAASYAALPPASDAEVSACVAAVLERAAHGEPAGFPAPGRAFRPRWWWGAAAAAVLVVTVSRPWRADVQQRAADSLAASGTDNRAPVGATREDGSGAVRFELSLPQQARAVAIVGDFNGWDETATPMVREGGEWAARVPLPPGRHVYAFVVDGATWLVDPMAPQVPDAGFGPANAVIVDPR